MIAFRLLLNLMTLATGDDRPSLFNSYFDSNVSTTTPISFPQIKTVITYSPTRIETNRAEVTSLLSSLPLTKASLPSRRPIFIKNLSPVLSCYNFQQVLCRKKKFPGYGKKAINKQGPKSSVISYRPVSRVFVLLKIYEKIMSIRTLAHVFPHLWTQQPEFIPGASCETNLAVL